MQVLKDIGTLFYLISPYETAVERIEDIPKPNYVVKAIPYFLTFFVLEYVVQVLKNKRRTRINDGITSLATGLFLVSNDLLGKGAPHYFYIKVYENWRLVDLPWDSAVTWWLAAIGVDFLFYWIHRASHEMNFLWAHHQVHHSSEHYNLTTAVRQPGFQVWFIWIFYIPLALFIPPPIFMIHQQFNLLFQFWIHTEIIDSMGPLEWVLNTPKHHRIHHGSNRFCLDKNYAGWLIIWDRMFGTFAEEKPGEEIKYGLVEDVKSFNPFWLQIFYVPKIWNRMKEYNNWGDKLSVLLKGPGWSPGKPRLGDVNEVPLYPTREIYDVKVPAWKSAYVVVHFFVLLLCINFLAESNDQLSQMTVLAVIIYVISSLTSTSFILEDKPRGVYTEALRCLFTTCLMYYYRRIYSYSSITFTTIALLFISSTFIWFVELAKLQFIGYRKYRTE